MGRSSVLLAWVGSTDLRAPTEESSVGLGPVAQAATVRDFAEFVLLSNFPRVRVDG